MTKRILLVDDHEVVRQGLRSLLDSADDLEVIGEAGSVKDAISLTAAMQPDVVVLDVRLPDGSGVDACKEIRQKHPDIHVLMLTSFSEDRILFESIMAGASGYLLKQVRGRDLIDSVRSIAEGKSLLDPSVTEQVLTRIREAEPPRDPKLARLSPTETRILQQIATGATNREIAEDLKLAEKTIKNYVTSILGKLEVGRRAEAAAYLAERRAQGLD